MNPETVALILHFNALCPVRMNTILKLRADKGDEQAAAILRIIPEEPKPKGKYE